MNVNGRRSLLRVIALGLASVAGIIGMLLTQQHWADGLLLALAALPLAWGGWCWWSQRSARDASRP